MANRFQLRYGTLAQWLTYSLHKYMYWLIRVFWVPFRLAKELKQICRLRSNCFCTLIPFLIQNFCLEILQLPRYLTLHIFLYDHPHFHLKWSHKTTFEEIFLNNVVAYAFTYTMVSAQFHRNVPILRSLYCGIYSLGWRHCMCMPMFNNYTLMVSVAHGNCYCSALATENCQTAKPQSDYQIWIWLSTITRVILLALILESINYRAKLKGQLLFSKFSLNLSRVSKHAWFTHRPRTYKMIHVYSQSNCWSIN